MKDTTQKQLAILIAVCAVVGICIASITLPTIKPGVYLLIMLLNVSMFALAFRIYRRAAA